MRGVTSTHTNQNYEKWAASYFGTNQSDSVISVNIPVKVSNMESIQVFVQNHSGATTRMDSHFCEYYSQFRYYTHFVTANWI